MTNGITENTNISMKMLVTIVVAALAIGGLILQVRISADDIRAMKGDVKTISLDMVEVKGALGIKPSALGTCENCKSVSMSCTNCK